MNIFFLFQCVHLYVCKQCFNFQDLCASLLRDIPPFVMFLTFITCFAIDFLSLKRLFFSVIATDDRHPLRSRLYTKMLYFAWRFNSSYNITQPGSERERIIPSVHVHVLKCDHLPVSKNIMAS